jgi:hypothetical protein
MRSKEAIGSVGKEFIGCGQSPVLKGKPQEILKNGLMPGQASIPTS